MNKKININPSSTKWLEKDDRVVADYFCDLGFRSLKQILDMVLKNYIGGMAVVAMSGRPAQRQDQAVRIARFAVTPESLRVSMTLRV